MAITRNEDYPVFKKWYAILDWTLDKCDTFPKSVRFTISSRLANISLDVLENIIEAIYSKEKAYILKRVNLYIEKLRVIYRLSFDRRYISMKQYEFISKELNEFGKMVGGWLKHCGA